MEIYRSRLRMTIMPSIDSAMQQGIHDGVFPAAELLVGTPDHILHHAHYGQCHPGNLFDVASLTKVLCTTTLAMMAVSDGKLTLTDKLSARISLPQHPSHRDICIYHLLHHSSGLPAHRKYYLEIPTHDLGRPAGRDRILNAASQEVCEHPAGQQVVYSDIGFILLGRVLEEVWGTALDALFAHEIARPLGLHATHFVPAGAKESAAHFVPTEDCSWRKRVLRGEVHDQNCYAMGSVAGHAGLFGTATDIHQFARIMVAAAGGVHDFLNPSVVQNFLEPITPAPHAGPRRVLGWDIPEGPQSQAGRQFSPRTIGHLGYTGCSIWIDLQKKFWVILLSNRVHPSASNDKIRAFRPMIHDLIYPLV
jgi:CubicO group peptidase (beta-lactamase class C family)